MLYSAQTYLQEFLHWICQIVVLHSWLDPLLQSWSSCVIALLSLVANDPSKNQWPQLSRSLTPRVLHLRQSKAFAYCNAKSRPCLNSASRPGRAARPRSPAFRSPATTQHNSVKVGVCDVTAVRPTHTLTEVCSKASRLRLYVVLPGSGGCWSQND